MSGDPDHPFLTARHVDALTEAVRALNATITRESELRSREHRSLLHAIERIVEHTANLPAVLEALVIKHSNGDARSQPEEIPHVG